MYLWCLSSPSVGVGVEPCCCRESLQVMGIRWGEGTSFWPCCVVFVSTSGLLWSCVRKSGQNPAAYGNERLLSWNRHTHSHSHAFYTFFTAFSLRCAYKYVCLVTNMSAITVCNTSVQETDILPLICPICCFFKCCCLCFGKFTSSDANFNLRAKKVTAPQSKILKAPYHSHFQTFIFHSRLLWSSPRD